MIKKKVLKRVKTSDVIGNNYGVNELKHINKYNLYQPENQEMIVTQERPLTFTQLQRKLKQIHPGFFIVFNANVAPPEYPMGHAIRFKTKDGHDPICGVGKSGSNIIPAQSTYNHYFNKEKNIHETRLDALGWVAAEEMVIQYLVKNNISPVRL